MLFESQSSQTVVEEGERKQRLRKARGSSLRAHLLHKTQAGIIGICCPWGYIVGYIMEVNKPGLLFGDVFYSQLC